MVVHYDSDFSESKSNWFVVIMPAVILSVVVVSLLAAL